jgi:PAS domain S-box-containing protein
MADDPEVSRALTDDALRSAVDAAPDGIIVVDDSGTIVFLNPTVETMFGYGRDELLGKPIEVLVPCSVRGPHVGDRERYIGHPRTRVMGSGLDLHGLRRSGEEFPVEISLSPVHSSGGDGTLVIAIVRDITDRRQIEVQLDKARGGLILIDERERIARDLHDTVIQRLFAVGLSLQAALTRAAAGPAADRIGRAIDDIDATIRDLRSAIFALHTRRPGGASVRDEVLGIVHESARALGFEPTIAFSGPIDSAATDQIKEQLAATLRESLSNVAKHADAHRVDIAISVADGEITLRVLDDGVGIDHAAGATGGNGLINMRARAVELGGSCEAGAREPSGTAVEWRVPVVRDRSPG